MVGEGEKGEELGFGCWGLGILVFGSFISWSEVIV